MGDYSACPFDLSGYIQPYQGQTKLLRLFFVAERDPTLKNTVNQLILNELQNGFNTSLYEKLSGNSFFGSEYTTSPSTAEWIRTSDATVASKLEILMTDFNAAKASMVKESLRSACMELGHFYYKQGLSEEALKFYMRAQEGCSLPQHFQQMTLHVVQVSIDLNMWSNASTYVANAGTIEGSPAFHSKLSALQGLVHLQSGLFKSAATHFLSTSADAVSSMPGVLSKEDVAVYSVVCGLASLDRADLKIHFVEKRSFFNDFLSTAPMARDLLMSFYNGNYSELTKLLPLINMRIKMDLHMCRFAEKLLESITERMYLQYMQPYAVAEIERIAAALNTDANEVENMLVRLISTDKLQARIDSQKGTVFRFTANSRDEVLKNTVKLSTVHINEVKRNILRLSLLKHNFYLSDSEILCYESNVEANESYPNYGSRQAKRKGSAGTGSGSGSGSSSIHHRDKVVAGAGARAAYDLGDHQQRPESTESLSDAEDLDNDDKEGKMEIVNQEK